MAAAISSSPILTMAFPNDRFATLDRAIIPLIISELHIKWGETLPAELQRYIAKLPGQPPYRNMHAVGRVLSHPYYEPVFREIVKCALEARTVEHVLERVRLPEVEKSYTMLIHHLREICSILAMRQLIHKLQKSLQRLQITPKPQKTRPQKAWLCLIMPYLFPKMATEYHFNEAVRAPYKDLFNLFRTSKRFAPLYNILAQAVSQLRSPSEVARDIQSAPPLLLPHAAIKANPTEVEALQKLCEGISMCAIKTLDLRTLHGLDGKKWAVRLTKQFKGVETLRWPFKMPISGDIARKLSSSLPIRTLDVSLADKRDVTGVQFFSGITTLLNDITAYNIIWETPEEMEKWKAAFFKNAPKHEEILAFPHRSVNATFVRLAACMPTLRVLHLGSTDQLKGSDFDAFHKSFSEFAMDASNAPTDILTRLNPKELHSLTLLKAERFKKHELAHIARFEHLHTFCIQTSLDLGTIAELISCLPKLRNLFTSPTQPISIAHLQKIAALFPLRRFATDARHPLPKNWFSAFSSTERLAALRIYGGNVPESDIAILRRLRPNLSVHCIRLPEEPADAAAAGAGAGAAAANDRKDEVAQAPGQLRLQPQQGPDRKG